MARWPQWRFDGDERVLYQADGGLVDARRSIATHVALARWHGATIVDNTKVLALKATPDGVDVETNVGSYHARRVVVAADAWTNQVLAGVGVEFPLTVTQEQVTYFATPNIREFAPNRFPIWIWHGGEDGSGWFYGFPVYGEVATKAGEDVGGDTVTGDTRTFEPNPRPFERLTNSLGAHCPGALGPVMYTKTCLYTMTPDRNFIIEQLPECPQVSVAVGAAHAFKFSSLIGQILTDLAVEGDTRMPIAPFNSRRRAITDPTFPVRRSASRRPWSRINIAAPARWSRCRGSRTLCVHSARQSSGHMRTGERMRQWRTRVSRSCWERECARRHASRDRRVTRAAAPSTPASPPRDSSKTTSKNSGVGTGGTPKILGQVELDASIMDGRTSASGAVGAVKHYGNPIEIARKVMELTPHVMLVGDGAELFAETTRLHQLRAPDGSVEAAPGRSVSRRRPTGPGATHTRIRISCSTAWR